MIIIIIYACSTEDSERKKAKLYNKFYFDDEFEDFMFRDDSASFSGNDFDDDFDDDFTDDFATNDLKNSYFTKNLSDDYNSYYAQIHDNAEMDDKDSAQEMQSEFGDDWEGEF